MRSSSNEKANDHELVRPKLAEDQDFKGSVAFGILKKQMLDCPSDMVANGKQFYFKKNIIRTEQDFYHVFNLTFNQAYELLTKDSYLKNLVSDHPLWSEINLSLNSDKFLGYLSVKNISLPLKKITNDNDDGVIKPYIEAFIDYNLRVLKKPHPVILQLLSNLLEVNIYIWGLEKEEKLVLFLKADEDKNKINSHSFSLEEKETNGGAKKVNKRIDLLSVGGHDLIVIDFVLFGKEYPDPTKDVFLINKESPDDAQIEAMSRGLIRKYDSIRYNRFMFSPCYGEYQAIKLANQVENMIKQKVVQAIGFHLDQCSLDAVGSATIAEDKDDKIKKLITIFHYNGTFYEKFGRILQNIYDQNKNLLHNFGWFRGAPDSAFCKKNNLSRGVTSIEGASVYIPICFFDEIVLKNNSLKNLLDNYLKAKVKKVFICLSEYNNVNKRAKDFLLIKQNNWMEENKKYLQHEQISVLFVEKCENNLMREADKILSQYLSRNHVQDLLKSDCERFINYDDKGQVTINPAKFDIALISKLDNLSFYAGMCLKSGEHEPAYHYLFGLAFNISFSNDPIIAGVLLGFVMNYLLKGFHYQDSKTNSSLSIHSSFFPLGKKRSDVEVEMQFPFTTLSLS